MAELLKTGRRLKRHISVQFKKKKKKKALKINTNQYWKELLPEIVSPVDISEHMGRCETCPNHRML